MLSGSLYDVLKSKKNYNLNEVINYIKNGQGILT